MNGMILFKIITPRKPKNTQKLIKKLSSIDIALNKHPKESLVFTYVYSIGTYTEHKA